MNDINNTDINPIKRTLLYLKCFFPLFLSHHPDCEHFKEHTIKIGKYKFCIGCFIGYPIAILTLILNIFLKFDKMLLDEYIFFLSIIFLSTFSLSFFKITEKKIIKIIQKILMGIGGALLLIWILGLNNTRELNILIAFYTINIIVAIFSIYHIYGFFSQCYKCETNFNWAICSGFENIRNNLNKNGLENILKNFNQFSEKIKNRKAKKQILNK